MHDASYRESARATRVLVIRQRRAPLWLFLLTCVLFGALGTFLIARYTQSTTLVCERDDVAARCTLVEGWPLLRRSRVFDAASLVDPHVEWSFHQEDEYFVRIGSPGGNLDLGTMETEGDARTLAAAITRWLGGDERGRRVFEGAQIAWMLVAMGVAFIAIGCGSLAFARRNDLEIVDDGVELVARRSSGTTLGRIARGDLEAVRSLPLEDDAEALTLVGKSHSVSLFPGATWTRAERTRVAKQIEDFVRDG